MNEVAQEIERFLPAFGYACDVGANDGIFLSNSLWFEQQGWLVLCIEANPLLEEMGRKSRKLWRAVAAGEADKESATLYLHGAGTYPSSTGFTQVSENSLQVPMYRLDRLLEEAGFPRLDYLTMDVEEYEDQVLSGFTIKRWNPRVIVAESWTEGVREIPGYTKHMRIEYDDVFVREDVYGS